MNERVDPNDYVYLLAASRAGVQGTPIFFDEVPRVARLCADGLLVRLPSTEGRIYGSAVITEDAGRVLSRIASEESVGPARDQGGGLAAPVARVRTRDRARRLAGVRLNGRKKSRGGEPLPPPSSTNQR